MNGDASGKSNKPSGSKGILILWIFLCWPVAIWYWLTRDWRSASQPHTVNPQQDNSGKIVWLLFLVAFLALNVWGAIVRTLKATGRMETTQQPSEHVGPAILWTIISLVLIVLIARTLRQLLARPHSSRETPKRESPSGTISPTSTTAMPEVGSSPPRLPQAQAMPLRSLTDAELKDFRTLFLQRDVKDDSLIAQCKAVLDTWSGQVPFSPIKQLGGKTAFCSATEHAAYKTTVISQIEKRWLEDHEVPYRGQALPNQFRSGAQFDPWKMDFPRFADFASHHHSIDLPDTRKACDCSRCRASGEVTCSSCSGSGEVTCYSCGGRGHKRKTREIPYVAVCTWCDGTGHRSGNRCTTCGGGGRVNKTRTEEYYVPCESCAASGKVTCSTCGGSGKVTCPRCEGERRLMAYVTAEQTEEPAKGEHQFVPTELPPFKKKDHPLSNLEGEAVFTQDEQSRIATFGFGDQQAAGVLSAEVETCRNEHEGHMLRQQIKVERCSIVEYHYRYAGKDHTIFINPKHGLVEDIAGPIQMAIENMDALAKKAFDEKRYEDAYRLNLRSLCMDEATAAEKQLRGEIFKGLDENYFDAALATWFLAAVAWLFITQGLPSDDESLLKWLYFQMKFNFGILLGLLPLLIGVHLFARDTALRLNGRVSRVLSALMIGICALSSGAAISTNSLEWDKHNHWADWLLFAIVILVLIAIAISRSDERSRRSEIEKHTNEFDNTQALEEYVSGLNPSAGYEFRVVFVLFIAAICLVGAAGGLIAYHMNKF